MTQPNQPGAPGQQPVPTPGAMDANDPAFKQATQGNGLDPFNVFNPLGAIGRIVQYDAQYIAASGSGKFQIDPAEIQPLLAHWQDAIDKLKDAGIRAAALASVDAPSDEDASNNMVRRANESGRAYLEHNKELISYCQAEQDKLRAALQTYQQNEEHNAQHASGQYRK